MRIVLTTLAFLVPVTALAQGSLLDMGKSALQQRLGQAGSTSSGTTLGQNLSTTDITAGLKEALRQGSATVIGQLGATNGFNADPKVHIPLPGTLRGIQSGLKMAGMSGIADDLELKLNRAAESAMPQATQIFTKALQDMSVDDARAILNGSKDSATQYFRRAMSPGLKTAFRPVVDSTVAEAGVVKSYEALTASAKGLPMVGDGRAMLTDHVVDYALQGVFHYLAEQEAAIRDNPAKTGSELLSKVFAK